jgi:UDP-N-acetylmuramoylalanine--D-glutamate ligase
MDLTHKKVLVVGLGKTGEALAEFLLNRGARVKISENKRAEELGVNTVPWEERGVELETGGHRLPSFLEAELIVLSPGVPPFIPELGAAKAQGIRIVSEMELAFWYLKGTIVGITGSNGKSTTATLAHKILKEGGFKAFLAGNIGTPLVSFVEKSRNDHVYVTEISSFQLHDIERFRAAISVFLNISLNHLDWHGSFGDYYAAKKKLFTAQAPSDIAILNRDDRLVWSLKKETRSQVYAFSRKTRVSKGCCLENGWLVLRGAKDEKLIKAAEIPLAGVHNQENAMAAALIGHSFGISAAKMQRAVKGFRGLEHRLEKVLSLKGVDFINDSKATTVDATIKALDSFSRKTILIIGGRDKGDDFTRLRRPVKQKVCQIILIGEAKDIIKKALEGVAPMALASSMKEAVSLAFEAASFRSVVLLAPACASFDMFKNYEDRGLVFKKEVRALARKYRKDRP